MSRSLTRSFVAPEQWPPEDGEDGKVVHTGQTVIPQWMHGMEGRGFSGLAKSVNTRGTGAPWWRWTGSGTTFQSVQPHPSTDKASRTMDGIH